MLHRQQNIQPLEAVRRENRHLHHLVAEEEEEEQRVEKDIKRVFSIGIGA